MKQRFFRQLISLVLLLTLAAGIFTGCGSTEDAETDAAEAPSGTVGVLVPSATVYEESSDQETSLRITEVMFSNRTVIRDQYGAFSDWIELENTGSEACSTKGLWLSDDKNDLMKWQFPDVTVPAGARLLVFCSGNDQKGDELHTSFSLSRTEEGVYLSYPSGNLLQSVTPEGEMKADQALCVDASGTYTTWYATPGYPNTDEGRLAFIEQEDTRSPLVINEVCPLNESYNFAWGGYYDWIELRNISDADLELSEYYLTDDPSDPTKFPLPAGTLAPGRYFMVTCSGDRDLSKFAFCSFMFALGADGDRIYLFDSRGDLVDRCGINGVPLKGSIGRLDNQPGFFLFARPTPEKDNTNGYRFQSTPPVSLTASGIYEGVDHVSVELQGTGQIHYTTDGSVPDENSPLYTGPLTLTSTTAIRAVTVVDGKMPSQPLTLSFIINEHHTLPVVSLVCNERQFRSVYTLYSDRSRYCDTTVQYFGEDGEFSADCSLTLHGASARRLLQKKHLKLTFKDRYGGDLDFNLFGNENFTGLHSFTLRGGETQNLHIVRDSLTALIANDVSPVDPYTLDSRYCVMYLNGKYYGLYAMREAYSGKYVETHTGIPEENALICRAPELGGTSKEFFELATYITSHDVGKSGAEEDVWYDYIDARMDLKSLAVWMCLESYFNNSDPTGNVRYFKDNGSASDKWKFMFFDLDNALGNPSGHWGIILNPSSQIGSICYFMIKYERFRTLLLQTAAELIANGLTDENCIRVFQQMIDEISPEVSRDMARWGGHEKMYEVSVEHMVNVFSHDRMKVWLDELQWVIKADDAIMAEYFPDFY